MGSIHETAVDGSNSSAQSSGEDKFDEASWGLPTCWQRFTSTLSKYPDRPALVCLHHHHDQFSIPSCPLPTPSYQEAPYLRWTYRNLKTAVNYFSMGLRANRVCAGMPVVTFLLNGAEYVVAMMAAHMMGCPFAPLHPKHLASKGDIALILGRFMQHTEVKGAVANSWLSFGDVLELGEKLPWEQSLDEIFSNPTDEILLCTSGTTSHPKVVVYTTAQTSYYYAQVSWYKDTLFVPEDVILNVLPNNHLAGWDTTSSALLFGGCLVFASAGFDVMAIEKALHDERVTWTNIVPTMIQALAVAGIRAPRLKAVALGGSRLTPEVLKLAVDVLGAAKISPMYGSTELGMVRAGSQDVEHLVVDEEVCVGWARRGQLLKACMPGDRYTVLPAGQLGELHISSPAVCNGYVGISEHSSFYADTTGRRWYVTGDQARIDREGKLFIVGRYNDMIIRGGENISPAAVEAVLWRHSLLRDLDIQVVRAPDPIAGEVPVAVTSTPTSADTVKRIKQVVQNEMTPECTPEEVISTKQLGIEDYPRTPLGKVKKNELSELVRTYQKKRQAEDEAAVINASNATRDKLRIIWARALGVNERMLGFETPVTELADSISVMRVRDRIGKIFGSSLTPAEILGAATHFQQAVLLDTKLPTGIERGKAITKEETHPPDADDIVHLVEFPDHFQTTRETIEAALRPASLAWDDVRAVMPAYDMNRASLLSGQMNLMNVKTSILIKSPTVDKPQLRAALEKVLANNRMLASFIVFDKTAPNSGAVLHVVVDQSQSLFNRVIRDGGSVETINDLKDLSAGQHYPECRDAVLPGPLVQMTMLFIEQISSLGLIFNANHSVIDATFAQLVLEDIEDALACPNGPLRPHDCYKQWADSCFMLRDSPAARAAVKYHVANLSDLAAHKHAIWPPHPPAYVTSRTITTPIDGTAGLRRVFETPGLKDLATHQPDIAPSVVFKAALALALMRKTGHTHSLFGQTEADRMRWPFLPKSLGERPATDVGGLTIQVVVNLVSIVSGETVLSFLRRMQTTQTLQTRYASAPRLAIMDALGPDAGPLIPWIATTALFNWIGAQRAQNSSFEHIAQADVSVRREAFGFFVVGGLAQGLSGEDEVMWMTLRGATLGLRELTEMAEELGRLTRWLLRKDNWEAMIEVLRDPQNTLMENSVATVE
ncbi:acetyl-CoA synthetase-like protein [Thozetella sp. PMI_491]|nr:acetyl-CoA synthetase-like protein [Thozetella sp. PMI_491]